MEQMASKVKYIPKIDYFYNTYKQLQARPNTRCRWEVRNKFIICEFNVTSGYSGSTYTLCLNYEKFYAPRVWVVEPSFMRCSYLPHVYFGNRLCLYHPDDFVWTKEKDIVQTIMCWAAIWIDFYEIWKETGVWLGPEAEHKVGVPKLEGVSINKKKLKKSKHSLLKDSPIRY